ncbi:MAG: hypothetical protein HEQ17_00325 [Limnohabitans sp.]|nr:hypothetical protein [Limnohabitans sp.]
MNRQAPFDKGVDFAANLGEHDRKAVKLRLGVSFPHLAVERKQLLGDGRTADTHVPGMSVKLFRVTWVKGVFATELIQLLFSLFEADLPSVHLFKDGCDGWIGLARLSRSFGH